MVSFMRDNLNARCIIGGPATGKSTAIAQRARALIASGEESVLVMCAAPASCDEMKILLGDGIHDVQVRTAREVALEVLADPDALVRFGRIPHVLDAVEMNVLFEDMRSCGLKQRRLRELLEFLYCGWSGLRDEDPHWIQTVEEERVAALVRQNLAFTGGVVECEATNLAVKALRDEELRARHLRHHVLVDDYCLLGKASQVMACMLSGRSIALSADDTPAMPVYEPYPYHAGLAEFLEMNPQAAVDRLVCCFRPSGIVSVLNNVRSDEDMGGSLLRSVAVDSAVSAAHDNESVRVRMEPSLVEECRAICETVQLARAEGTDASDILIVGTNAVWRANVTRALEACGVPVRLLGTGCRSINFCYERHIADVQARAVRRLACNLDDSIAWRTWCACGDALARSASFTRLRQVAEPLGISLAEALHRLDADELEGARINEPLLAGLVEVYRTGLMAVQALVDSSACEVRNSHEATDLAANFADDEYSRSLQGCVMVAAPVAVFGQSANLVIFGGFVNGFIPSRDYCDPGKLVGAARVRAHRHDVQAIYLCASRARERLLCTGFTGCGLETGERLRLHIARIRLRDGARTCAIEPSDLVHFMAQ